MKQTILTLAMFSGVVAPPNGYGGDTYNDTETLSEVNTNNTVAINNAKILSQDEANIAITINKNLSGTVINTHTGERIKPCVADIRQAEASLDELIKQCHPKGHEPNGKILAFGSYTLREGSYCYTGVVGNTLYVYCQPPLNLGFP